MNIFIDELDLDHLLVTGSAAAEEKARFDLGGYPIPNREGSAAAGKKAEAGRPLDLDGLRDLAISGTMRVGRLTVANLVFRDLLMPLSLVGGTMTYADMKASFYGGTLTSSGRVAFGKGLAYDCLASAKGIDFGELARDMGVRARLDGKADFSIDVNGRIERTDCITDGLNGHVAFATGTLICQDVDKEDMPKGRPLIFATTRGSAS